ncbi:MAG: diacylglycerol kinase family lipid kinase [Clostridiales bacterium]|nr:diacylglycerol kinase family lipid kinase [Clostridiales bacterium]
MSHGRTLVIINPTARHGITRSLVPVVASLLEGHIDHDTVLTEHPGHAAEIASGSAQYDTVIAVGGDGTVHEVLNGLMRIPASDRPILTVLPTGSGNDYRRTLGIPSDLTSAVRELLDGVRVRLDVGVVNGVYFANSIAIGLDARVTARAAEIKMSTGWSGLPLYLRALMYILLRRFYSHPVVLSIDGSPPQAVEILLIAITNGPTYGGGFRITPDAVPDDGLLDVCTIDRVGLGSALWRLPFVITGNHTQMSPVKMGLHRSIRLESETPLEGQLDGEVMLSTVYDIHIEPSAVEVLVPRRWRP